MRLKIFFVVKKYETSNEACLCKLFKLYIFLEINYIDWEPELKYLALRKPLFFRKHMSDYPQKKLKLGNFHF